MNLFNLFKKNKKCLHIDNNQTDQYILNTARKNQAFSFSNFHSKEFPHLGRRWDVFSQWTRKNIENFSTIKEAIAFARVEICFEPNSPAQFVEEQIPISENIFREQNPDMANEIDMYSESQLVPKNSIVESKGRPVSMAMLRHVILYYNLLRRLKKTPKRIFEIGGGFGSPARLSMQVQNRSPEQYIIVDLPESLFFAEIFLRAEFGFSKVHYVTDGPLDADSLAEKGIKFILCPLGMHEVVAPIKCDAIINYGSFQEMSDSWIDFYHHYLSTLNCHHLTSVNYFGQPLNELHESSNTYSPHLSSKWNLAEADLSVNRPGGRNIANAFYTANATPPKKKQYQEALDQILLSIGDKTSNLRNIFHIMDNFRFVPTEQNSKNIIKYFLSNYNPIPKETLFVARLLRQMSNDKNIMIGDVSLDECLNALEDTFINGTTSIVRPKLENIIRRGEWTPSGYDKVN